MLQPVDDVGPARLVGHVMVQEHGRAAGEDGVGVEVLADVHVALHDGVVGGFVDTSSFHTQEGWLEEGLRASETLVSGTSTRVSAMTTG